MIVLIIGVTTILALLFGLLAVAITPEDPDKIVRQRLAAIPVASALASKESAPSSQVLKEDEELRKGSLQWLLIRYAFAEILRRHIAQGAGTEAPARVFLLTGGLAVAGGAIAWFFFPVLPIAIAGGAGFGILPSAYIFWRRSRRIAAFSSALPEAIDMMARALRAGHSMAAAIEMVAIDAPDPVGPEFGEVFRQQNFGLPLREALMQMLEKVPSQDLRVLITAIIVQRDTGGNLIELLDRSAFLIRDRVRLRGEIRTHTAQGRMTGWVLCALPIAMLVLINLVDPGYSSVLFTDPFGRKLVYGGIGLLVIGSLIINTIVNGIDL